MLLCFDHESIEKTTTLSIIIVCSKGSFTTASQTLLSTYIKKNVHYKFPKGQFSLAKRGDLFTDELSINILE